MADLTIDIGIDDADRDAITERLSRLLADSYTHYLKTHNYHWNVTGPISRPCTSVGVIGAEMAGLMGRLGGSRVPDEALANPRSTDEHCLRGST